MVSTSLHSPSGFEELPAELYDEIFSHLPETWEVDNWHSHPVRSKVVNDHEMHVFDYLKCVRRNLGSFVRPDNLRLRLVSRAFNRAMTRLWFQHEYLILRAFDDTGMDGTEAVAAPSKPKRRIKKPSSVNRINNFILQGQPQLLPQTLRRLRLEFSTSSYWNKQWLEPDCPESHPDDRDSLLAFLELLPAVLEKTERLECLWINLLEFWNCDYRRFGDKGSAPQIDLVAVNALRNGLCSLFSLSYAHNFTFLTELNISLPCTYDFAALNNAMSDEATRRLRHLYLNYVDGSGPGGSNTYLTRDDVNGYDGDEEIPCSNPQKKYPNCDFMPDICKLIGRCCNLESLGVHATHHLNLDELDWKPLSTGLKNIYINRAVVHFDTLLKLLSAADTQSSNVVALRLDFVELLDHTWSEIFTHLIQHTSTLQYFSIRDLNYAHRGTSSHFREYNNRVLETTNTIWTEYEADKDTLQDVVGRVLDARGVLGPALDFFFWRHLRGGV